MIDKYKHIIMLIIISITACFVAYNCKQYKDSTYKPYDSTYIRLIEEKADLKAQIKYLLFYDSLLRIDLLNSQNKENPIIQYNQKRKADYTNLSKTETDKLFLKIIK